jgi:hypothetical protein
MFRPHALPFALSAAVALAAVPATAQPVPVEERADLLEALFSDIGHPELRVETLAGTVASGRLGPVRPQNFVLESPEGPTAIDYSEVRAVAREGGHGIQGAIWGGAGGALAGGFFGMIVHSYDCVTPEGCDQSESAGGVRGALIGGAVGALIGFVFGHRQSHWHPIYP